MGMAFFKEKYPSGLKTYNFVLLIEREMWLKTKMIWSNIFISIKGVVLVRAQYHFYVFIWLGKNKNFVMIFGILAEKKLNFKMVAITNDLNFILTMKYRLL